MTQCHICHARVSPLTFTPPNIRLLSRTKENLHEQSASPFPKPFPFALNISKQQREALIQVRWAGFDFLKSVNAPVPKDL